MTSDSTELSALYAQQATLELITGRAPGLTVCPSEVARAMAGQIEGGKAHWRNLMPTVHVAVDRLLPEQRISLSWKGEALISRSGPYRISGR